MLGLKGTDLAWFSLDIGGGELDDELVATSLTKTPPPLTLKIQDVYVASVGVTTEVNCTRCNA